MGLPPLAGSGSGLADRQEPALLSTIYPGFLAIGGTKAPLFGRFLKKWLRQLDESHPASQPDPP
jgi:hypothetical protein